MELFYFCSVKENYGGLAQLARALAWHARGHEFESRILRPDWNPGNRWNHSVSGVPSFPLRFPVPSRFPPNASFVGLGFFESSRIASLACTGRHPGKSLIAMLRLIGASLWSQ